MTTCACETCRAACRHEPGAFRPEQVNDFDPAKLDVRYRHINGHNVLYITPAVVGDGDHGECVFLRDERCSIYTERPAECAAFMHGDTPRRVQRRLDRIVAQWDNPQALERVKRICETKGQPCSS